MSSAYSRSLEEDDSEREVMGSIYMLNRRDPEWSPQGSTQVVKGMD